jgi:hypothetical protein
MICDYVRQLSKKKKEQFKWGDVEGYKKFCNPPSMSKESHKSMNVVLMILYIGNQFLFRLDIIHHW